MIAIYVRNVKDAKNVLTQTIALNCAIVVIVLIVTSVRAVMDVQIVRNAMIYPAVTNVLIAVYVLIAMNVKM